LLSLDITSSRRAVERGRVRPAAGRDGGAGSERSTERRVDVRIHSPPRDSPPCSREAARRLELPGRRPRKQVVESTTFFRYTSAETRKTSTAVATRSGAWSRPRSLCSR
jgi:hypothetical protein